MTPPVPTAYPRISNLINIDENGVCYPETDGEPLPDGFYQAPLFEQVTPVLRRYLERREVEVIVSGDTFIYYEQGNPTARIAPDCYVTFGVSPDAIRPHNSYFTWHVGKVPDFVLEIASASTDRRDLEEKRVLYARLGIGEYWRYDATLESEFYGEPLAGERLVAGVYERLPVDVTPGGMVRAHSPVLGLDLCWEGGRLWFYDPVTGEYLRDLDETEAALEESEAACRAAEVARQREAAARQTAEVEVAELREQLRRLRGR